MNLYKLNFICPILNNFLIFRIFVYIVMVFRTDLEGDYGRVPEKCTITYLEPGFGRNGVIIIRIFIPNVSFTF